MEKFAERYTLQNEDVFPSADTAFILSFAVIMLQTDLHNPNIKPEKKMTCPTFINLNSGISPDGDLPPEFLAEIFNSIKYNPFTLKEDDAARETKSKSSKDLFEINGNSPAFFGGGAEGRKRERFRKERAELMAASEELFKRQRPSSTTSVSSDINESVRPSDVVKPMFDVTWGPLIGALSQILELSDDDSSVALCLNGFVYSVRIAMHTGLSLARSTFITTLAKFTALGSIKEMKSKNIESIRTLLSIAVMDGEYLNDCWISILQCISQLGRLQLFASGLKSDDAFLNEEDPSNSRGSAGSKAGVSGCV
jgi:brefeldin A-inhibited guanine nucleotide-exchange protein